MKNLILRYCGPYAMPEWLALNKCAFSFTGGITQSRINIEFFQRVAYE